MKKHIFQSLTVLFAILTVAFSLLWLRSFGRSSAVVWTSDHDSSVNNHSGSMGGVAWVDGRVEFGVSAWSGGPVPGWHAWDQANSVAPTFLPHQGPGWALSAIVALVGLVCFNRFRAGHSVTENLPGAPLSTAG